MLNASVRIPAQQWCRRLRTCNATFLSHKPLPEKKAKKGGSPIIRVSGTGGAGGGRGITVEYGGSRYMFNCGESSDRHFKDSRWNSDSLRGIFLTHPSWPNMGGLASVGLFLQEKGIKYISLYGPKGADKWLEAAAYFVKMYGTTIDFEACDESKSYGDSVCKIQCIPLRDKTPPIINRTLVGSEWQSTHGMTDFYRYERKTPSERFLKRKPEGPVQFNTSFAYICTFSSQRKVSLSKCVMMGIKPGPQIYQLYAGEDVTLEDGSIVKSSDVLQSPLTKVCALVVECPTKGYVDDLIGKECLQPFYSVNTKESLSIVVHFTQSSVMKSERYIKWMKKFPENVLHLVVNDTNSPNTVKAAIRKHGLLRPVYPQIFPLLSGVSTLSFKEPSVTPTIKSHQGHIHMSNSVMESSSLWNQQWKSFPKCLRLVECRSWTCIDLESSQILRNDELDIDPKLGEKELSSAKEFIEASKLFQSRADSLKSKIIKGRSKLKQGPVITFLGTGSQKSSTTRNVAGVLVQLREDKHMLLDCGEGTLGQLAMLYNSKQLQKILASLSAVYISHLHADHHLGLLSVILAHKNAVSKAKRKTRPLLLLAPEEIVPWLSLYHSTYEPILDKVAFIPLRRIELGSEGPHSSRFDAQLRELLDMALVSTCRVNHCVGAFGVSFIHKDGWKLTYSGDTKFCPSLVKIGMGSDLLIHEATFSSHLQDMARKKFHSTTKDAINAGNLMNAKHIILTHFSQRYDYLPDISDLISTGATNVGIAFDFMQVRFEDLPILPMLNDIYKTVYPDKVVEVERKTKSYLDRLLCRKENRFKNLRQNTRNVALDHFPR